MNTDFSIFESKIGISFTDKSLLKKAFTHRSYVNEHRGEKLEHNERIEFLGDAVLELVTTEYLFALYPDKTEGELTSIRSALVNTNTLSSLAQELSIGDLLLLSKGEAKDKGRARSFILANTFEAVIGAIYLDQGYEAAKSFIEETVFPLTREIVEKRLWLDAKSDFQEKSQDRASITPSYETLDQSGPDHDKIFKIGVFLGEEMIAEGEGQSKQEAEQNAARNALEIKNW